MKNLILTHTLMAMLAVGTAAAEDGNAPSHESPLTTTEQPRDAAPAQQMDKTPELGKELAAPLAPQASSPTPVIIRKTSFSEAPVPQSEHDTNHRRITIHLPLTASDLQVTCEMRNSAWGHEEADLGPPTYHACDPNHGECSIGWAKVRNLQIYTTPRSVVVSADFYNWRIDNTRWGRLKVTYTP